MTLDRRSLIGAGLGLGAAATAARATESPSFPRTDAANASAISPNLIPDDNRDQTAALQAAIDTAAEKEIPLVLPPGKFIASDLRLRAGTRLLGTARTTTLAFAGGAAFITADKADGLVLDGLTLEGAYKAFDVSAATGSSPSRDASTCVSPISIFATASASGFRSSSARGASTASRLTVPSTPG